MSFSAASPLCNSQLMISLLRYAACMPVVQHWRHLCLKIPITVKAREVFYSPKCNHFLNYLGWSTNSFQIRLAKEFGVWLLINWWVSSWYNWFCFCTPWGFSKLMHSVYNWFLCLVAPQNHSCLWLAPVKQTQPLRNCVVCKLWEISS